MLLYIVLARNLQEYNEDHRTMLNILQLFLVDNLTVPNIKLQESMLRTHIHTNTYTRGAWTEFTALYSVLRLFPFSCGSKASLLTSLRFQPGHSHPWPFSYIPVFGWSFLVPTSQAVSLVTSWVLSFLFYKMGRLLQTLAMPSGSAFAPTCTGRLCSKKPIVHPCSTEALPTSPMLYPALCPSGRLFPESG